MPPERRRCAKCGNSTETNLALKLHQFPLPKCKLSILRAQIWATYAFPGKGWDTASEETLKKLHCSHKMLCQDHFDSTDYTTPTKNRLNKFSIPKDQTTVSMTEKMAITEKEILHGVPLATTDYEEDPFAPVTQTNETTDVQPIPHLDLKNSIDRHTLKLNFGILKDYADDPPALDQTGQIESSINVDTGEEEVLETEEIVYDDGYRCPSPEVVEKEIPKVLPVLCVKCSQLIETHLYVCASCSDSQYEPLCATCAEHAALDAHAACYVLRARVTRPKSEIRGVLCAIRSELAMKSFADDLEDAITDIKSETADIPEDTDVLDVDPFDEIDSAVAVSAEGDPNASLTTSDNEDTDYSSLDGKSTASHVNLLFQDLLSPKPELDITPEIEGQKSSHLKTSLLLPKTQNVIHRIQVQTPSRATSNGVIILRGDDIKRKSQDPVPKVMPVRGQSNPRSLLLTIGPKGMKRIQENIDNSTNIKKVKSNISEHRQQERTNLITVKKRVNILQKDVQMASTNSRGYVTLAETKSKRVEKVPTGLPILSKDVIADNLETLPRDLLNKPLMSNMAALKSLDDHNYLEESQTAPESMDLTTPEENLTMEPKIIEKHPVTDETLTMKLKTFEKLTDQLRDCKVVLKKFTQSPTVKTVKLLKKKTS